VPLLGSTCAAFLLCLRWSHQDPPLGRSAVRQLAAVAGAAHAILGAVAYAALYGLMPYAFDFPPAALWVLAPAVGLVPGGLGLALTLVAGDTAVHVAGGWREP
jgi:hypothetical protein